MQGKSANRIILSLFTLSPGEFSLKSLCYSDGRIDIEEEEPSPSAKFMFDRWSSESNYGRVFRKHARKFNNACVRWYQQNNYEYLAIVRTRGKPHLFITMNCNQGWKIFDCNTF